MKKQIKRRENAVGLMQSLANLHPVLARVYASRSISSEAEIERELEQLLPFQELKNIDLAVKSWLKPSLKIRKF